MSYSVLTQGTSTSNGAATASVAVPNNGVVFIATAAAYNGPGNGTELAVGGTLNIGGWTRLNASINGQIYGSRRWLFCYRGVNTSGSEQSGTITLTFSNTGAVAYQEHLYSIDLKTGANTSTPNDTVVEGATGSGTALNLGDVGTPDGGDSIYAAFAFEAAADSFALDAALTELGSQVGGANVRSLKTGYDADAGDETPGCTWASSGNGCGGVGFIVNAAAGGLYVPRSMLLGVG